MLDYLFEKGPRFLLIDEIDGFPPSPPQPFLAKEAAGATAPEAGPPTPIIAGEQQVTSSVTTAFLVG